MALTTMQIQILKNTKDTVGDSTGVGDGVYTSTFVGEDGYTYKISGNEIITIPSYIGVAWLAADANLEQVGNYS